MEPIHRALLSELDVGKFHSLSRDELCHRVAMWLDEPMFDEEGEEVRLDRRVRSAIEWLRQNDSRGAWIVSDAAWSGYWFAESIEEVKEHCRVTRNTAYTLFKRARQQVKLAEQALEEPEQIRMAI